LSVIVDSRVAIKFVMPPTPSKAEGGFRGENKEGFDDNKL